MPATLPNKQAIPNSDKNTPIENTSTSHQISTSETAIQPSNSIPTQSPGNISSNTTSSLSLAKVSKSALSDKKAETSPKAADLDSSNALYLDRKPLRFKDILSKLSLSAFYAPGITNDFLRDKDNDPTNAITAHALKSRQDGDGTFATGLRLAYDISNRWSIITGCYYSLYSYNINPTIIYAQQQENGTVGYSITTSSGTVFLPYSTGTAHIGDSIKVKGSSSRGYLSIPLQAKYKIAIGRKLDFYATGGFSVNFAHYKETQIHWENTALQEGDLSVQNINGLNMVQYSYNFGFGAEYLVRRGLSIYAEPYLNGSFTSINNNTPVITYPYFFGLAFGVSYHF
jgi:hypothetical protein